MDPAIPARKTPIKNALNDLCQVLESARHRARVQAIALADGQGFLIAGAGQYATCEALSAEAATGAGAPPAGEIEIGRERVLLCSSDPLADHHLIAELVRDCGRILAPLHQSFASGRA